MARTRTATPRQQAGSITVERAARLYRILAALRAGPKTRAELLTHLHLDVRGFYRDLEKLRELEIHFTLRDHKYRLSMPFDEAMSRLPFPDPQLNVRDALELAKGRTRRIGS